MVEKHTGMAVEVEDLTVSYDVKPVLVDVDIAVPAGRLAAVIGPNGAGKTTLVKAILGLLPVVSGEVRFPALARMTEKEKRTRIAYVPQSGSVDWDFPSTVEDIVLMGRYGHVGWIRRPGKEDVRIAREKIEKVGMSTYRSRQIGQLSGGQQQRVFLARALAQEADIYFMDEPFKGVDAQTEKAIVATLKDIQAQGKTVLTVHHDLQTVPDYFDWVILVNRHIIAQGPMAQTFTDENVKTAYRSTSSILSLGKEERA